MMRLVLDISDLSDHDQDSLRSGLFGIDGLITMPVDSRGADGKWAKKLVLGITLAANLTSIATTLQPYLGIHNPPAVLSVQQQNGNLVEIHSETAQDLTIELHHIFAEELHRISAD